MRPWPKWERVFKWPRRLHCRKIRWPCLPLFLCLPPPQFFFFSLAESSPQSIELYYPPDKCPFIPLPTEMCVCPNPLPSGPVKRETEDRRAGEDKGGHQTVNPGCCSPHKKRGEWLTEQELFLFQFLQKLVQHWNSTKYLQNILESQLILLNALHVICSVWLKSAFDLLNVSHHYLVSTGWSPDNWCQLCILKFSKKLISVKTKRTTEFWGL